MPPRHPPPRLPRHRTAALAALWCLALGAVLPAQAQNAGLADPTRPPGVAPVASPRALANGAARPLVSPASAPPAPLAPKLQSVQLGAGRPATALVDGRLVRVGDRIGEAQVVTIDLQGLQLQGPHGAERLPLLSAVIQKTPLPNRPAPPHMAAAGEP